MWLTSLTEIKLPECDKKSATCKRKVSIFVIDKVHIIMHWLKHWMLSVQKHTKVV